MSAPPRIVIDALNRARRWAIARKELRRLLDSRSATQAQRDKAQGEYRSVSDDLEQIMLKIDSMLRSGTGRGATKKTEFPWKNFFSMVVAGAQALERAVDPPTPSDNFIRAEVVDMKDVK